MGGSLIEFPGRRKKRFRWLRWRFEWGRHMRYVCMRDDGYAVANITTWEWDAP